MKRPGLNLARRPFVNSRPVYRLALLLWVLGIGLLIVNAVLYRRHFSGRGEDRQALVEVERAIADESAAVDALRQRLAGLDVERRNREIGFLNGKIAERSFPWSALFDRLEEVLPASVRLNRVAPRVSLSGPRARRVERRLDGREAVYLSLGGTARSSEAILGLVDRLFAHPSFLAPDLSNEARREDSSVDFSLTVVYLPRRAAAAAAEAGEGAAGGPPDPAGPAEGQEAAAPSEVTG